MALEARRANKQQAATAAECSHLSSVLQSLQVGSALYMPHVTAHEIKERAVAVSVSRLISQLLHKSQECK